MEHKIIKIKTKEERRLVASILFANGYTVKETVIIDGKTKRTVLEYWEEKYER